MNEQDVRALVREAIERHLGRPDAPFPVAERRSTPHASHLFLKVAAGSEAEDGSCLIEPAVRCNHCGFCQSYGH